MTPLLILAAMVGVFALFNVISWQLARTPEERATPRAPWLAWLDRLRGPGLRHGLRLVGALAVVVLAVSVVFARGHGLLGGRDDDGPLRGAGVGSSVPLTPGGVSGVAAFDLTNGGSQPVVIESATVGDVSPGARMHLRLGVFPDGAWKDAPSEPTASRAPEGALMKPGEQLAVEATFHPVAGGRYYGRNLTVRYRQGARRFVERVEGQVAVCSVPPREPCAPPRVTPRQQFDGQPLVERGGPMVFPPGASVGNGFGNDQTITLPWRSNSAESVLELPIYNRSGESVRLLTPPRFEARRYSPLSLVIRESGLRDAAGRVMPFHPVDIAPRTMVSAHFRMAYASCRRARLRAGKRTGHLQMTAEIADGSERVSISIPLALELSFKYPDNPPVCKP